MLMTNSELGRLHYRHLGQVGSLENLADVFAGLPVHPTDARPGAGRKRYRHYEAEHPGGFEIDSKFALSRIPHREYGSLGRHLSVHLVTKSV